MKMFRIVLILFSSCQLIFLLVAIRFLTSARVDEKLTGGVTSLHEHPVVSHVKLKYPGKITRLLAGVPRSYVGFLTIGISTVWRKDGVWYLSHTLASLINNVTPREHGNITIVVSLADANATKREWALNKLYREFHEHILSGLLRVIHANQKYYPRLTKLKIRHRDSAERVAWRSKQNVDYAHLMLYSAPLSLYYLHLEDDVIAQKDYLKKITDFIKINTIPWTCLQLTGEGFIGVSFRSEDLVKIATLILLFYDEKPVDWLLDDIRKLTNQRHKSILARPLFYHIGNISTLIQLGVPITRRLRRKQSY